MKTPEIHKWFPLQLSLTLSDRQNRRLRHFLRIQSDVHRWLSETYRTYPGSTMAKVKTLGKAYTEYKRTMPDRGWDTVYSQPLRALIYNCFLKGRPFEPESIVFSSAQGWELASGLTVSKVGTIKISDRPHLRSYRNGIHLADVGIPTTLKLTLSRADEWSARVGVNTGDRIIAISTWNDECGHHCDENISVGDLVEKVDVRTYHEIEEPIYAWCHTDCICPICDTVWPGCDGHSDEDDDGEVDEGGDYE